MRLIKDKCPICGCRNNNSKHGKRTCNTCNYQWKPIKITLNGKQEN